MEPDKKESEGFKHATQIGALEWVDTDKDEYNNRVIASGVGIGAFVFILCLLGGLPELGLLVWLVICILGAGFTK
jgi:hypothetical protein